MSSIAELVRQSIENLYQILDELKRTELNRSELKLVEFPKRTTVETGDPPEKEENQGTIGTINFSKEEILKMPKEFRPLFRTGKVNARVRKKGNGYEVRCQVDGERISVYGKLLYEAKAKFIVKLADLRSPSRPRKRNSVLLDKKIIYFWQNASLPDS